MAPAFRSFHSTRPTSPIHDWLLCALTQARAWTNLKNYIDRETESVVLSLARSLESRDPCTEGHCERLAAYAVRLGQSVRLREQLDALAIGGIVHDVGKVAIPDAVLLKPGRLTAEERHVIEQHPVMGEHICAPLKSFREVLPIIRHHHERMDGSGYPDGLCGDDIPLTARILQTVDVFDALTMDRPYRRALTTSHALRVMFDEVERGWLDGTLVQKLEQMVAEMLSRDGLRRARAMHVVEPAPFTLNSRA